MSFNPLEKIGAIMSSGFIPLYVFVILAVVIAVISIILAVVKRGQQTRSNIKAWKGVLAFSVAAIVLASAIVGSSYAMGIPGSAFNAQNEQMQVALESESAALPDTDGITEPEGIELDYNIRSVLIGDSFIIHALLFPEGAEGDEVEWESSNSNILSVTSNGMSAIINAISEGTAVITATLKEYGFSDTCEVTVTDKEILVTGISLNRTSKTLDEGQSFSLEATVEPADATNMELEWTSSNTSVASVSGNGSKATIKAGNAGTATITVETIDGGFTATCIITVKEVDTTEKTPGPTATPPPAPVYVTGVSLNCTSKSVNTGDNFTLTATVSPSNADNKNVNWSTSNSGIASISGSGSSVTINANSAGSATITVTTSDGSYSKTCNVTITDPYIAVTGVTLSPTSRTMDPGQSFTLTATVFPANATNQSVSWISSNGSCAGISGSGSTVTISALTGGTSTITVTTAEGSFQAHCSVTVSGLPAPQNVHLISKSSNSLTVGWNSVSGAVQYRVHFNGDSFVGYTSGTSLTMNGLSPNTQYYVKVYAKDSNGNWGEQSENVPFWTD